MALGLRIGAKHTKTPVRPNGPSRPGLLAVDNVLVSFQRRGGPYCGHIGTGIRL